MHRLRVQRHRGRADEASARTVDRMRSRVIRQQVGHGDVRRSQRLAISRQRAAERRTLDSAEERHHIHAYNIEFSNYNHLPKFNRKCNSFPRGFPAYSTYALVLITTVCAI